MIREIGNGTAKMSILLLMISNFLKKYNLSNIEHTGPIQPNFVEFD